MTGYLDHYCERIAPGFWGEPFNLLSNLAFIVAGVFVGRFILRNRSSITGQIWDLGLLTALLFTMGVGSSLWHLFANSWSLYADTIPILLFINIYLLSSLFRLFSFSIFAGLTIFAVYHAVNSSIQSALPPDFLNGSIFYLPSWFFLMGITLFAWRLKVAGYRYYAYALVMFTVSLTFRTVDQSICDIIPTGTHFVWHLLNAVTLYLLMLGLINNTITDSSQQTT
ncbi:hypothetical protein [Kaarinaea lacus]